EALFCAELLVFVWLFLRFLRHVKFTTLLLAALALGLATYVRPVTLFLSLWLAVLLLFFPRTLPARQRFQSALCFFAVVAATLAPWFLRNAAVAGYKGFASVSDIALYFYSAAAINARLEHRSFSQEQEEMGYLDQTRYFQLHPEQRGWSEAQIYKFEREQSQR